MEMAFISCFQLTSSNPLPKVLRWGPKKLHYRSKQLNEILSQGIWGIGGEELRHRAQMRSSCSIETGETS